MSIEEFLSKNPHDIRRNAEMMQQYIDLYVAAFSLKPNCAGCSFNKDYQRLKKHYESLHSNKKNTTFADNSNNLKNISTMDKKFEVKRMKRNVIHTYIDARGKAKRSYGYNMTYEFALELVKQGKSNIFSIVPKLPVVEEEFKHTFTYKVREENEELIVPEVGKKVLIKDTTRYKELAALDYSDEIAPLYKKVSKETGKKALSRSKHNQIIFIIENE